MAAAKASLLVATLLVWQLAALGDLPEYILSPAEIARHFFSALASAELAILPGEGHWISPQSVQVASDFLRRHGKSIA